MLDYIVIIESGGLILFEKSFLPSNEKKKMFLKVSKFIKQVFLSQKEQSSKKIKINEFIFEYNFNKENKILTVIVYLEKFGNDSFSSFLEIFVDLYQKKYLRKLKKQNKELIDLLQDRENVGKDFNFLLGNTDFTKSTVVKKKKWEKNKTTKKVVKKINKREWDPAFSNSNKNKKQMEKELNKSSEIISEEKKIEMMKEKYLPSNDDNSFEILSSDDENEDKGFFGKLKNTFSGITEGSQINEKDLDIILETFKNSLVSKNVAEEISRKICENLKEKLKTEKSFLFTSTKKIVKQALKESLTRILTPKKHIDLLAMALKKKEEGRPFVITFIGVNGVGKSTNLAKVAYMFKNNGFSVLLAGCDNFRAGAIEQIKTHGKCLNVPVFERGYKDDPANIAKDAIAEANSKKIDIVLIDTAGRMQDNEPLMKALARLVNINNPDVVLFIGEALTGNDGVDQLMKFNKSLYELSSNLNNGEDDGGREIDGVILTKFDTVDDKVGATLSLTYATGKPIVFVGTGQKYDHLKKLNIDFVIKCLLN